ncbi:MAG: N-acetylglucosamine kinase [Flavobacteriales bacterium]|nr:N-acetylglucosamine kinase [Flavobacteriales bacterium]
MIIVADSGSTKTSWLVVSDQGEKLFEETTEGLNPAVFPVDELLSRVLSNKVLIDISSQIKTLHFFGAGCGTEKPRLIIAEVLQSVFKNAKVNIKEDTEVAVMATTNKEPAIVCILGTGSNCSYFDGEKIHQKVVSLGYIIMDDASGNYFGKQLLKTYYFNQMPADLAQKFEESYNLDADYIKENLYRKSNPNTYLADLGHFIIDQKNHPFCQKIIKEGLQMFVENQILQFKEAKQVPINFVGSIAHFLNDEIVSTLKENGLTLGVIQRHPIKGFVEKHIVLN